MSIVLLWSDRCNDSDCQAPGFLCPWDSPGKNIGEGSHSIPQGISLTQGLNPYPPALQVDSLPSEPPGKPCCNTH